MRSLMAILVVLCVVNFARAAEPSVEGEWVYSFAELLESDGKTYKTSVSGELKLTRDGKFEQSRRIGGILNPGKGTYVAGKNQLMLKYADGSKKDTYTFTLGTHKDRDGKEFKALTLVSKASDGSGFKYLLTKKPEKR